MLNDVDSEHEVILKTVWAGMIATPNPKNCNPHNPNCYPYWRNWDSNPCCIWFRMIWECFWESSTERMDRLNTLFTIDTQIIHSFTFRTNLLSTWNSVQAHKIHQAFQSLVFTIYRRKRTKRVWQLARLQWSHVAKLAWRFFLIAIRATFLKTFMYGINCYEITTISA